MSEFFIALCQRVIKCDHMHSYHRDFKLMPDDHARCSQSASLFVRMYLDPLVSAMGNHARLFATAHTNPVEVKMHERRSYKFSVFFRMWSSYMVSIVPLEQKQRIEMVADEFSRSQRAYYALGKFVRICRVKCARPRNHQSLMLEDISEGGADTYTMIHCGAKYVFRVNELRNSIMSCIANTDEFFPEPRQVNNPYNNLPLSNCALYNFYFFLKTRNYGIPALLHGFFLSAFDEKKFVLDYEILIRDKAIEEYVLHESVVVLYSLVFRMLVHHNRIHGLTSNSIQIAKGFPVKKLVEAMRPYLRLFLFTLYYVHDLPKQHTYADDLWEKLAKFSSVCPNFGERIETADGAAKYIATRPVFQRDSVAYGVATDIDFVEVKKEEDVLYNRIQEMGMIDAWCADGKNASDYEHGSYVRTYYMIIDRKNRRMRRSPRGTRSLADAAPIGTIPRDDADDVDDNETVDSSSSDTSSNSSMPSLIMDVYQSADTESDDDMTVVASTPNSIVDIERRFVTPTQPISRIIPSSEVVSPLVVVDDRVPPSNPDIENNENDDDELLNDMASLSMSELHVARHILHADAADMHLDRIMHGPMQDHAGIPRDQMCAQIVMILHNMDTGDYARWGRDGGRDGGRDEDEDENENEHEIMSDTDSS